jgi:hypothetical protein
MPAKKPQPWYSVVVYSFIDEAAAQEQIVTFERITAQSHYSGYSWPKARHALGNAVVAASRDPLAFSVQVLRESEPIIKVRVEH